MDVFERAQRSSVTYARMSGPATLSSTDGVLLHSTSDFNAWYLLLLNYRMYRKDLLENNCLKMTEGI